MTCANKKGAPIERAQKFWEPTHMASSQTAAETMPRLIFQTWKTREVPEQWREAQRSVVAQNPGWTYVLLTDEDNLAIVRRYFPAYVPTYLGFEHDIQRADAVRYMLLYLWGGVYLDLDYVALRSFDAIVLDRRVGLLPSNNAAGSVTNSLMCSMPRCDFWLECLNETARPLPWWAVTKHLRVFTSTGPFMLNRVWRRNRHRVRVLAGVSTPCGACSLDACVPTSGHIVKPIDGRSWHAWDSRAIDWVHCNRGAAALASVACCVMCCALCYALVLSVRRRASPPPALVIVAATLAPLVLVRGGA